MGRLQKNNVGVGAKVTRYVLGGLLLLLALNAFAGGYYGMAGAEGVPVIWLKGSPFRSYFIPGLVLFTVVGGSALVAAILVFRRHRLARSAALACSTIVFVWLSVQVLIIGYVSWMQPTTAIASALIFILALQMPKAAPQQMGGT